MWMSKKVLTFWSALLISISSSLAQGVFTSSVQLLQNRSKKYDEKDSSRSFPITYLDKSGPSLLSTTTFAKATLSTTVPSPVKDRLSFLNYVDSLSTLHAKGIFAKQKEVDTHKSESDWDRWLNRLRDVPSILPFFVSSATASKTTCLIKTRLSSGFGMRQHPISGSLVSHSGIDLPAPMGTLVYATADGYCRQIINQSNGIGLGIYLIHGRGHQTLYGHLLTTLVKPGEFVMRGQVIGQVGASGLTTGPHLHYGVRYNGLVVDPLPYCFLLAKPIKVTRALTRK
ncbi:M23 family metallopeptidase [Spirosoma luteum]|uniref:M23 family metallopeptidase n=1 Tax=Spirosoma luteum TaxID=431553 RepID=UPI00035EC46A|nr:M23 family metallopeptidase [Spirosoma luteum]